MATNLAKDLAKDLANDQAKDLANPIMTYARAIRLYVRLAGQARTQNSSTTALGFAYDWPVKQEHTQKSKKNKRN